MLLGLLAGSLGCGSARAPRPTLLDLPPPVPPPGADETRLLPVELQPDAREPLETAPAPTLAAMSRRALDDAQTDVLACYERLLVAHPNAEGSVEVQLDLDSAGRVTRAHLDQSGHGGLEGMVPCLHDVFAAVRVREVSPRGQFLSRVYAFTNPPVDRAVQLPVVVHAPAPPARPRLRRGPPAPPPPHPPPPRRVEPPAFGSLRPAELTEALANAAPLPGCAALALRRVRRAPPPYVVRFTVSGTGAVTAATVDAVPPPAANVAECVTGAVRGLRLRASGITLRVVMTLQLQR